MEETEDSPALGQANLANAAPSIRLSRSGTSRKALRTVMWVVISLIVIALGLTIYTRYFKQTSSATNPFSSILGGKAPDKRVTNNLDGTLADPLLASRNPLGIIIENHQDARPQYGLSQASIVYEAIAEGGITRFLAFFGPRDADKVGPVRSARTYFVDWTEELNGYLAHVGGNIDALDQIRADRVLDLDQFGLGETAYHREPRAGLATEHTMFTSTKLLYKAAEKKYGNDSNYDAFTFKKDPSATARGTGGTITIDFSQPSFKVTYQYDQKTNTYLRTMAGAAHKDAGNGQQIAPSVVVVIQMNGRPIQTRINENGWELDVVGSNKATVYQDGAAIQGTWKKKSDKDRMRFYDSTGKELTYDAGQMWIEVVSPGATSSYVPVTGASATATP